MLYPDKPGWVAFYCPSCDALIERCHYCNNVAMLEGWSDTSPLTRRIKVCMEHAHALRGHEEFLEKEEERKARLRPALVYVQTPVVVNVADPSEAPAEALAMLRDSLNDPDMAIKFDVRYMDEPSPAYVVVGGEVVGEIP